jgi:hypothetical protein
MSSGDENAASNNVNFSLECSTALLFVADGPGE